MTDPMAEIRASFFVECEELLESLQDGLQALSDGATDPETVNVVFRAVHSIKGGAGAFGLEALVGFAHSFESALDEVRAGRLAPADPVLRLFFTGSDLLADLVRESRDGLAHDEARLGPVLADLDALTRAAAPAAPAGDDTGDFQPTMLALDLGLPDEPSSDPSETTWRIAFHPEPGLFESGNEPLFLLRALGDLGQIRVSCDEGALPALDDLEPETCAIGWIVELTTAQPEAAIREVFEFVDGLCRLEISASDTAEDGASVPPAAITPAPLAPLPAPPATTRDAPPPAAEPPAAAIAPPRATVRVDLERIDRLVNLVGEIVINQAMLSQSVEAAGLPPNSPVRSGLEEFLQLTRDIQDSVMMIRAQPVKSLFQRMSRIVREASAAVGKEVRLHTEGENTEVDKTVIERLADPLTHMIRNAVDHGLEDGETRLARGKPREGRVSLSAMHRSGRVVIEVADDGAGLDRTAILAKAIERGLVAPDATLSESEIDNLLFLPGFSTARQVSNLSGRGVGLDVVRSAIQALGGRVSIQSDRDQGTRFTISLPLTLAVLDGMVITVAGETLVVPLNAIQETLALRAEDIRALGPAARLVRVRDRYVPLLDLGAELGYRPPLEHPDDSVVLLIGQEGTDPAALVVDSIDDQRQVVIKGLQDSYGRIPGIAAATILGDGQIALILDPADLLTRAHTPHRSRGDLARTPLPSNANQGQCA